MTPDQLRDRARREIAELGPEPADTHDRDLWLEERRGAIVLLAVWVPDIGPRALIGPDPLHPCGP